jgi:hypothetical protein
MIARVFLTILCGLLLATALPGPGSTANAQTCANGDCPNSRR